MEARTHHALMQGPIPAALDRVVKNISVEGPYVRIEDAPYVRVMALESTSESGPVDVRVFPPLPIRLGALVLVRAAEPRLAPDIHTPAAFEVFEEVAVDVFVAHGTFCQARGLVVRDVRR